MKFNVCTSWTRPFSIVYAPASFADKGISFENNARGIGALRIRAKRSCRRRGLPRDSKHERAACLLRRSVSGKNREARGRRAKCFASRTQRPLPRRRRPNHRQAEKYLSRLLNPAIASLSRERRERKWPGHWRANITPIVQPAAPTRGATISGFVMTEESSSEEAAAIAAARAIRALDS